MLGMTVIWFDQARGNWDSGLLTTIFEKHPNVFTEINTKAYFEPPEKAIVIICGRPDTHAVRSYLELIKGGLVILCSEEDAYFDWRFAIPERFEIWTQYYAPSKAGIKTRLLLGAPNRIKNYKINSHLPKKFLWSFVGQVQNPSRYECVEVLKGLPGGFLHVVPQFGGGEGGIEYQEYLDIMCQSKFVICPSGSMCVDSFRFYEAIECGAIPITEKRAPRDNKTFDYWKECGINDLGIISLNEWSALIKLFSDIDKFNVSGAMMCVNDWWTSYKQDIEQKLLNYAKEA